METTNIDSYGLSQTYINDDLVHGLKWDANYDGNNLNVGVSENTQGNKDTYFIQLDNQDIMDLLSIPASDKSLDQRLSSLAKKTRKKNRRDRKSSKHKKTHHHKRKHHRKSHKHHKKRHHSRKRKHKAPIDRVIY